jgi:hypothetical protein
VADEEVGRSRWEVMCKSWRHADRGSEDEEEYSDARDGRRAEEDADIDAGGEAEESSVRREMRLVKESKMCIDEATPLLLRSSLAPSFGIDSTRATHAPHTSVSQSLRLSVQRFQTPSCLLFHSFDSYTLRHIERLRSVEKES